MTGFLTGALAAVALSLATWFALNAFTQTSVERSETPAVNLEGVNQPHIPFSDVPHDGANEHEPASGS
ncbi:hypothetical protein [Sagittula salina]|uniref:Uncharacterized protein n=1 Tax=Sagittula salina TaxID=2820268 RepID=A0A940S2Y7_9RHOB|nr:hypothetical protein [Sagittula salina]MBP0484551.1 hypothetical protein [Sagittula salina]